MIILQIRIFVQSLKCFIFEFIFRSAHQLRSSFLHQCSFSQHQTVICWSLRQNYSCLIFKATHDLPQFVSEYYAQISSFIYAYCMAKIRWSLSYIATYGLSWPTKHNPASPAKLGLFSCIRITSLSLVNLARQLN